MGASLTYINTFINHNYLFSDILLTQERDCMIHSVCTLFLYAHESIIKKFSQLVPEQIF